MMKFYFVSYELRGKETITSNVILEGIHPLIWAAKPQKSGLVTYVNFWAEIPEEVANDSSVAKHFNIERA